MFLDIEKVYSHEKSFVEAYLEKRNAYEAALASNFVLQECKRSYVQNVFYVYAIIDPDNGEIVHIGKGSKDRWLTSQWASKKTWKGYRLAMIKARKKKPHSVYLVTKLSHSNAFAIEGWFNRQIFGATRICAHHRGIVAEYPFFC